MVARKGSSVQSMTHDDKGKLTVPRKPSKALLGNL